MATRLYSRIVKFLTRDRRLRWSCKPFLACAIHGRCWTHSWNTLTIERVLAIHESCLSCGSDPHTAVAARMFGILANEVTPHQRKEAKKYTLMLQYSVTYRDAERFLRASQHSTNQEAT
jgi:hypothetical protein